MKKFEHGGNIFSFAREIGCEPSEVTDLSSSINFLMPDIEVDMATLNIQAYPEYSELNASISDFISLPDSNFEIFNGATAAVFSLFTFLKPKICSIYAPAYLEYFKAAELVNADTVPLNRFAKGLPQIPENASVAVLVNPSTPDGKYYDFLPFLEECKEKNIIPIIDESFIEFSNFHSASKFIKEFHELFIVKSFTKTFGCAGIRTGIIIASSENIEKLREREPLWKISAYDAAFMTQALADKSFLKYSLKKNSENRKMLTDILRNFKHTEKIFHSDANFVLVKLKDMTAEALADKLKTHKIMIRNCANFHFLDSSFVRISVKGSTALNKFKKALDYA